MTEVCLRSIDLETVGLLEDQPPEIQADPRLGILELGWTDLLLNVGDDKQIKGVEVDGAFGAILFNPPGGIPPEASAIHHLTAKHVGHLTECSEGALRAVANSPPWRGPEKPFALVAHSASFERAWLDKYLPPDTRWICSLKVAARLFPEWKTHSNQGCKYLLGVDLPDELCQPPHRAGPDSLVTAHIMAQFLKRASVKQMVEWTALPKLMLTCPIGKDWRGKTWDALDESALRWIVGKGAEMDGDVLYWAKFELQRRADLAQQPDLNSSEY